MIARSDGSDPIGPSSRPGRGRIAHLALLGLIAFVAASSRGAAAREPASGADGAPIVVTGGARRSGDVVALGRAVSIDGELDGVLVVIGGSVRLRGRVTGDAILLFSKATVSGPAARVDGDLLAVGEDVAYGEGASPASVGGRIVSVAAVEAAFLAELRTSPLRSASVSPLLLSFRLLLLALWLAVGLLLLFVGPRRVSAAARFAQSRFLGVTAVGLSALLAGVLLSAFVLAVVPPKPAFVLVALVVAALAAAKIFGLAAIFLLVGRRLARNASRGDLLWGDPAALAIGLVVLGLASLVPAAGAIVWSVASLAGIGLALKTSFGSLAV